MNQIAEEILMHYGMPRRSGRYPWGSGDNPYQHSEDFLSRVEECRKQGFTYTDENLDRRCCYCKVYGAKHDSVQNRAWFSKE